MKILHVEDSKILAEIVQEMVCEGLDICDIHLKRSLKDAFELLEIDNNWDLIILDLVLLDSDKENTIEFISFFKQIAPVIVISSEWKMEDECLINGADKVFVKGSFKLDDLKQYINTIRNKL